MIAAACIGLTACGGSSGNSSGVLSTGILTDVEVPAAAMPSGSATYAGKWGIGAEESDVVVVGDLNMVAAFDSNTITGTVSNLTGDDNGTTLVLGNSLDVLTNINGNKIQGTANGTLTLGRENYVVNSSLQGAFGGTAAQIAIGETYATVKNPDGSTDDFSGLFAAEKQ